MESLCYDDHFVKGGDHTWKTIGLELKLKLKDVLSVVRQKWIMWNYNSNGYLILMC
jgi:hypothetical protein